MIKSDPVNRAHAKYNKEELDAIVRRIKVKQITVTEASKLTSISYGTLWNAVNGKHGGKTGGQTCLS